MSARIGLYSVGNGLNDLLRSFIVLFCTFLTRPLTHKGLSSQILNWVDEVFFPKFINLSADVSPALGKNALRI